MRVRTTVVLPFRKGSREKGDDYFGSLLPSLQLLFGLLLMPAGFSEGEVWGSRQEGEEEEEYKLLGHHPQGAGRAMSRNPHSYGALATMLLGQLGERRSSQFRQTPLYCSPPREEKERNTPQPSGSAGTVQPREHASPLPPYRSHLPLGRRFLPSSPWGRTSNPSSLSQAGGTGMDISLLDTQGNPQRTPFSYEPFHILLWPAENMCPSPCTYKDLFSIPSTMHVSTGTPPSYTSYSEREGKTGAFLWV